MGQAEINPSLKKVTTVSTSQFIFINVIGKGGIGKVWKVQPYKPRVIMAMKQMSKAKIIEKKMVDNVIQEKDLLSILYHPFIVNMYLTFQDKNNLYMLMDYLPCSDLRYQMNSLQFFSEEQIKFLSACIITGLEYIHSKNIVHRDIKPENIICDEKGYVRITDFGIAKKVDWDISNEISGTLGYMAPEVLNKRRKILKESDYFSLGVMLYELVTGERPYKGADNEKMVKDFESRDVKLAYTECKCSKECCDFINGLLEKDNEKRLGKQGADELKEHSWFNGFNWKHLQYKTMKSPIIFSTVHEKEKKIKLGVNNVNDNEINSIISTNEFDNYTFLHFLSANDLKGFSSRLRNNSNTFRAEIKSKTNHVQFASNTIEQKTPLNTIQKKRTAMASSSMPKLKLELPMINTNQLARNRNQNSMVNLCTIDSARGSKKKKFLLRTPNRFEGTSSESTLSSNSSSPKKILRSTFKHRTVSLFSSKYK